MVPPKVFTFYFEAIFGTAKIECNYEWASKHLWGGTIYFAVGGTIIGTHFILYDFISAMHNIFFYISIQMIYLTWFP